MAKPASASHSDSDRLVSSAPGHVALEGLLEGDVVGDLTSADLVRAMDHFGVSRSAFVYRLLNLKLLSPDRAETLRSQPLDVEGTADALGLRLRQERQVGVRLPTLLVDAWTRGLVTTGRAADLLGIDIPAFHRRMKSMGETQTAEDVPLLGIAAEED